MKKNEIAPNGFAGMCKFWLKKLRLIFLRRTHPLTIEDLEKNKYSSFKCFYDSDRKKKSPKILVVDDVEFIYRAPLVTVGYKINQLYDIKHIETEVKPYDIVLCDIRGVGMAFSQDDGGVVLANEIKRMFPFKMVLIYSSDLYNGMRLDKFLNLDGSILNSPSAEEFVDMFQDKVRLFSDPIARWKSFRDYVLNQGMSIRDVADAESVFVESMLLYGRFRPEMYNNCRWYAKVESFVLDFAKSLMVSYAVDCIKAGF